ncbi:Sec24B protein [Culex quinquefasciatus]|uniref:Sec24B protein n=1 Tax=Culex quinquefasciatus TaxID=7176 RepID=B0WA99_CULQU|nr:Sec24B protein [Culex quinquefasciatus]EDS40989.1 Sec24B protein [Culex quinquefasciatus]|eukprot:XP_001845633.1 Sec24B protein [Culex quinquefasciatus]
MPMLDGLLVDPEESTDTRVKPGPSDCRPGSAQGVGLRRQLYVYNSSLLIVEAPGKLNARDNRKPLGTDKGKTVLNEWRSIFRYRTQLLENNLIKDTRV